MVCLLHSKVCVGVFFRAFPTGEESRICVLLSDIGGVGKILDFNMRFRIMEFCLGVFVFDEKGELLCC